MKTQRKNLILLSFLMGICIWSQTTISGKVTFKNKPLKDINVTLKDSYDGATSDENGNYSFITSESGDKILVFSGLNYDEVEILVKLEGKDIIVPANLKAQINEINAVVITAGSIEASDKKRAAALLTPLDIYTTAGANGQITSALGYLPGVQKVGESEGLFVRGGTGAETKIFMDGNLINNYFTNSVPGIAGRDRFNTSLFKGNIFSSGGYSVVYGQALSSVLILESVDLPETTSFDFGVSPIFLSANYQKLNQEKTASWGVAGSYSNLGLMGKLFNFNTDFGKYPHGYGFDGNFRIKTTKGGFIKYYGSIDANQMSVGSESLEADYDRNKVSLKGNNTYHNLSYKEKFGKYLVNIGASYSFNSSDLDFTNFQNDVEMNNIKINNRYNYINGKSVVERKVGRNTLRAGFEVNNADENMNYGSFEKNYKDLISSAFAETDLIFTNDLSAKIGARTENSSYLDKWNFSPRAALAYRISKEWTTSIAYGMFYQNPESKYLISNNFDFQRADHYIFQIQKNSEGRNLRFEAFYKNYDRLIKTSSIANESSTSPSNQYTQFADNNGGGGFAKGIELFWRDKKTFKNIDYWLTYSYLDSKRDFLNYPFSLVPNFASKHTLNAVAKKFVMDWKTGFNLSYTYAKGRPYYDIISDDGKNILRNQGKLKDFSGLNFSVNYVPSVGKKDSKSFTVFVLSINNILGNKNVYGYNYSADGNTRSAVRPPVNTFVFVGVFVSFGVDKTDDAINNNL
ncbi:TonB-dependent receptor [Epilithonimonas ginsengisoli]|uniref:TonB-dependent receptor n=1 Tax=Epilithonimonas ginsengisoli TaxID=1245592 RepID=A0ABU4JEI6_9FLAO|nr:MULTISPECIES: TonB-dependent receptor [Chryseobacterium group]MBV6879365.1 TonB-dependent receptor [Epilithonimonas sp. FP105]MDW8547936.1 TonB-dependent receptor [Epilithonimonas ginsengisoli]OAH73138.1 TonB-dependent receptor [Chryseobacterium sp. FP211-J200]